MNTTKSNSLSRRHTAIHESAHAIVAHALGVPVKEAFIAEPPIPHGHCLYAPGDGRALIDMVIRYAGLLAEGTLTTNGDTSMVRMSLGDMGDIETTLEKFSRQDRPHVRQRVVDMATGLVTRHWSAITALADRLLDERAVDGRSIAAIFEDSKREIEV